MRNEKIGNCGCRLERHSGGLIMVDCPLHKATPELLEALEALVAVCPECNGTGVYFPRKDPITGHKEEAPCQWCKHARAAITKATGQEGHQ